jgi:hypothetical protein
VNYANNDSAACTVFSGLGGQMGGNYDLGGTWKWGRDLLDGISPTTGSTRARLTGFRVRAWAVMQSGSRQGVYNLPCIPQGVGSNSSQSNCDPLLYPWRIMPPSSTPSFLARSTQVAAVINESPTMWAALMAEVTRSSMM